MSTTITDAVREKYGAVAASGLSGAHPGVHAAAEAFGYSPEDLAALPAEANMGLSCGNPSATAHLRPGEVVVDLGCGGGIDVLLAAKKVGPTGKAVGIDMTPQMIDRARANAAKTGATNAEFHLAPMEQMPLAANSADCLISNCVLNLAADKGAVFREMYRVLKPGGRVAVSDIALKQPLPDALARSVAAYVGCVAGALSVEEYVSGLRAAGFEAVEVVDSKKDLNAYAKVGGAGSCCSPGAGCGTAAEASPVHGGWTTILNQYDVNEYAASVRVFAVKPPTAGERSAHPEVKSVTTLQVFDKPMCCSTGVCGPSVDPVLPKFAADLAWLQERGVTVERYNLAHQPQAFVAHPDVTAAIREGSEQVLPLVRLGGLIVSQGAYPSREQLASWCGVGATRPLAVTEPAAAGSSCGATGCC